MKINAKTKISQIIKMNPDSIDVIATINKNFKKLKNPILRKLLASRVSISDAAKIGGTTSEIVLARLSSIGFDIENISKVADSQAISEGQDFSVSGLEIIELDVRKTLKDGTDPFNDIMKAIKTLGNDQVIKVINTFEPIPLIKILQEKGFSSKVNRIAPDQIETYFKLEKSKEKSKQLEMVSYEDPAKYDNLILTFAEKIIETDVRQLEMPLPMVTILDKLEKLPQGFALMVHHKRIPQFLLGELENRSFNLVSKTIDEANVELIIFKL